MREYTNYKWGASDIDIVTVLRPTGSEAINIHDTQEISEAKWNEAIDKDNSTVHF